jgi:predicted secreted hydrolase
MAHAALSDIRGKRFLHWEDMAREKVGIAGAQQESGITTVFLKNCFVKLDPVKHHLKALTDDFTFQMILQPLKEPILHGDAGYSLKGSTPERSSCYYSFTRLETEGTLTYHDKTYAVKGSAWMDHEFSSAPLEPNLEGWDWFSLQFSDNTELMIYLMRQRDGHYSPASSGTFVDKAGNAVHLSREEFRVEVLGYWRSPKTLARYPSRWKLKVPSEKLDLTIAPNLDQQEMRTRETVRVTYWEGSVSVSGTAHGEPIAGMGYVELTGYEKPFDAPL